MRAQEVLTALQEKLGERLRAPEVRTEAIGHKRTLERELVWAEIDRDDLLEAVRTLRELGPLHISIISGVDAGDRIELIYHFAVGYGTPDGEVMVNFRLSVPKNDPVVPSICAVLPGALTTEREKIEFLGVQFSGIPDARKLFLPDELEVHPWRKDEPKLSDYVRYTVAWEAKKDEKGEAGA